MSLKYDTDLPGEYAGEKFGLRRPAALRFGDVPAFDEANPVLPESEWEEHDDLAPFWPEIEAQRSNNCTNASLASALTAAFRMAGVDAPRFSWAFNYARHNDGVDEGAMCRDLARDLLVDRGGVGMCPAHLWPDDRIIARSFPAEALAGAKKWGALEVYQCLSWAQVGSALTQRFVVYYGVCMGLGYAAGHRNGGIVAEYDGQLANGHAMAGRGLRKVNGRFRVINPNTWGTQVGDRGVYYFPESYFWHSRPYRGTTFVNLDAYAIRAVKRPDPLPRAG